MAIDFDTFFYYGENKKNIDMENNFDMSIGVIQPKKSLYYMRNEGAGVSDFENFPNALGLVVGLRYNIANWVSFRNTYISSGQNNFADRRVAVSQNTIDIQQDTTLGNVDILVYYISLRNYNNFQNVSIPIKL